MSAGPRRVVVTGLGLVSPIGNSVDESWKALLAGSRGAAAITHFDATHHPTRFACEVKGLEVGDHVDRKSARRMDRCSHLVVAAARQAAADAGVDVGEHAERVGVSIASAIGGVGSFEECIRTLDRRGADRVNPFSIVQMLPNLPAAWVSIELGARGPLLSESAACAASNIAIGDAQDAIRLGRADVMLCGGAEAPITAAVMAGFGAMRALSTRNDDPARASRPFDAGRDGFVMAEGAAVIVLEELEYAVRRGARIRAEMIGYGISSDANHVSEIHPTGANRARALQMTLADAGVEPQARPRRRERQTDADLFDEGRDRAHARRRGRGRGGVHRARARTRRPPTDDQLRRGRSGVRPRLHRQLAATRTGRGCRVELLRVRRPQHRGRLPPLEVTLARQREGEPTRISLPYGSNIVNARMP